MVRDNQHVLLEKPISLVITLLLPDLPGTQTIFSYNGQPYPFQHVPFIDSNLSRSVVENI